MHQYPSIILLPSLIAPQSSTPRYHKKWILYFYFLFKRNIKLFEDMSPYSALHWTSLLCPKLLYCSFGTLMHKSHTSLVLY